MGSGLAAEKAAKEASKRPRQVAFKEEDDDEDKCVSQDF
jgi:hypothetical protein